MSWISSAIGAAKRFFTGKKPERKPIPAAIAKQPKKSLIITTPKIVTKKQVIVKAPEKKDLIKYTYAEVKDLNKLSMDEYISTVKPIAELMQRKYGIYYMIPIIQSGHESAWGNSKLAREGLNLFGITATKWWVKNGGKVINFNTNEFVNGITK